MKNFYRSIFSLFVFTVLVLFGCTSYSDGSNNGENTTLGESSSDMGFIISFANLAGSRSTYYTIDEVSFFKVQVSLNSNVVVEKTAGFDDTIKIGLTKEGLYTIAITAYNSKYDPIADGSTQKYLYYDSGYQRVSISITPYSKTINVIVDVEWVQPSDETCYKIIYNLNGGKNHSSNPSVFSESDYVYLQSPTYAGYKFCGWYENENFSGNSISYISGNERNADVELWAKWQETPFVPFPEEAVVSTSGVYTTTLIKEGIGNGWASSEDCKFLKIVLAPRDVAAKMINGEIINEYSLFTDENMCYVYANNNVGNAKITVSNLSEDTYLQPCGVNGEEYTGLGIKKDNEGNYIVIFDITKINKDILLAKSHSESNEDVWENKGNIESDYVPMILGCVTSESSCYPFYMWNVGLAILEPTEEAFPENINKEILPTTSNIKYIYGNLTDWNYKELTNNTYEFTYSADTQYSYYNDYLEFFFYSDDHNLRMGDAVITSFNTEFESVKNGSNIRLPISMLTKDTKYVITFTATGDYTATVSVCPSESL